MRTDSTRLLLGATLRTAMEQLLAAAACQADSALGLTVLLAV